MYSLGVIFSKTLANYLAIEENELGFGVKRYRHYRTIFIYDTAKNGAGYSSQFSMYSEEILKEAYEVLNNCDCQSACTKCLVDRSTQWHLDKLDRHLALDWVNSALVNRLPEGLNNRDFKASTIFGNLQSEIARMDYHFGIKELNLHVNNNIENWELENLKWLENIKRNHTGINIIVEGNLAYQNNQEKISVFLLSLNYQVKEGINSKIADLPIHLSLVLNNGNIVQYLSKAPYANLDNIWTSNFEENYYKIEVDNIAEHPFLKLPDLSNTRLFEARIGSIPRKSRSNDLTKIMLENLSDASDFLSKIKGHQFKVSYHDKYNQSEFSLRLLLQFIEEIQDLASISISEFNVHLEERAFENNRYPNYILHNYERFEDYKYDLEKLAETLTFKIEIKNESQMAHYRYFEFESDELTFQIRIDGGIAHGFKPLEFLRPEDLKYENDSFFIKKYVSHDIIYNVSMKSCR